MNTDRQLQFEIHIHLDRNCRFQTELGSQAHDCQEHRPEPLVKNQSPLNKPIFYPSHVESFSWIDSPLPPHYPIGENWSNDDRTH